MLSYFEANFQMMQHHKYSLSEIDNLIPWEKEVYIDMLIEHLKEEKQRQEQEARGYLNGSRHIRRCRNTT